MRQHRPSVYIARSVYLGLVSPHAAIRNYGSALREHAYALEADVLYIGPSSDGYERLVALHCAALAVLFIAHRAVGYLCYLGGEQQLHAALFVVLLQYAHELPVVFPGDMIQHLYYGYLRAYGIKVRRHFQPYHAAAYHDKPLGRFGKAQQLAVGDRKAGLQPLL